jgi:hypothetical protein
MWEQALVVYAKLQIALIDHATEMRNMGVLVCDLAWIDTHTDTLLEDDDALESGTHPLTEAEIT